MPKKHTTKYVFTVYYIFAVCTHSKEHLCRALDRKHTGNYRVNRKELDSGSEHGQENMGVFGSWNLCKSFWYFSL